MDTEFGKVIWNRELYDSVVRYRSVFNAIEGVDYKLHNPATLSFIPPEPLIDEWRDDYRSMQRHFIYEYSALSFEKLMDRMRELTARIRKL